MEKEADKVEGLVLKNFYEKDYEGLEEDFKSLVESYEKRKYGVQLSADELTFVTSDVLTSAKWKGTECFAIKEVRDVIVKLDADKVVLSEREGVRALFHFLNNHTDEGVNNIDIQAKVLETVSQVIGEINAVERDLRDASVELQAKLNKIEPEQLRQQMVEEQAAQPQ